MDLMSDASSGSRILTTRHISLDKALSESGQQAVNTTLSCLHHSPQPDLATYVSVLGGYGWALWSSALVATLATCFLYALTLRALHKHWRSSVNHAHVVLAVYPIVAITGVIAAIVPRAYVLAEALAQEVVMVAMYHMYLMIIADCGGVDQMVRQSANARLETRVLPCCFWPCCVIPRPKLQKRNLTWLRYLVLQMPIIQGIIYTIILVVVAENYDLYIDNMLYIQPIVVTSILFGMWGVIMTVKAAESLGHKARPKFLALQLVLLIVKLQLSIAKMLPKIATFPCLMQLHPAVIISLIQNIVMILEMLLLSIWAWRLYQSTAKVFDKVDHIVVAVIDEDRTRDVADRSFSSTEDSK